MMDKNESITIARRYTSIASKSLGHLWDLCQQRPLPEGSVVECGANNGGSAVLIWSACGGNPRPLWMFDSWEGLPEPGPEDGGRASSLYIHHMEAQGGWCKGDMAKAAQAIKDIGCKDFNLIKGWFDEVIPNEAANTAPIACLHIDADWYASTWQCLEHLWPHVAPGGLVIFNDWGYWPGEEKAAREYFEKYNVDTRGLVIPETIGAWIWKGER